MKNKRKLPAGEYVFAWLLATIIGIMMIMASAAHADDLCDYPAHLLYKYQYVPIDGSVPGLKNFDNPTSDMYFLMAGRGFTLKGDYKVSLPMPFCEWFEDQKLRNDEFQQPVIVYKPQVYLINSIQKHFWFGLTTSNDTKYRFRELKHSGEHRRRQADLYVKHMKDIGKIPEYAVYDMILTVKQSSKSGWDTPRRLSEILTAIEDYTDDPRDRSSWLYRAFLTPHMLEYKLSDGPVYDPVVAENKRIKNMALPALMQRWRDSGTAEGKLFLAAAYREMKGMDPFEYIKSHGYIPADRSLKDMQYNYALRSSNKEILARNHKVEPAGYDYIDKPPRVYYSKPTAKVELAPIEPLPENITGIPGKPLTGYTYETKALYYEERRNAIQDNVSANQLVDRYLGVQNDYPDINATIMDNLLADYADLVDNNPYEGGE